MFGVFHFCVSKMEEVIQYKSFNDFYQQFKHLESNLGAFVFAFVVMLLLIGLPLFYLELTISQYSKRNPIEVWKISPIFQGYFYS